MKILAEPIDAIVSFRAEGGKNPRPYKFRFKDRDERYYEIKIDRIFNVEKWRITGRNSLIYKCSSMVNGVEKLYEIRYIIDECRWELYKM